MKDFFREMLIEPFKSSDWFDYVLGVLFWALSIGFITGFIYLSILIIDSSYLPIKEKDGVVTNKYTIPEHSTMCFLKSGKVMIPIFIHHDTSYNIEITIDNLKDDISTYEDYYNGVSIGQKIHCEYTNGRIKKSLYIKSLE